jgi:ADP-ribose pyrophosphatase
MALRRWKKIAEATIFKNAWWTYRRDMVELPSGKPGEYHYVHTNGSSLVAPITDDGKIVMVRQFRYLADRESIEFPCGSVKDGSTYDQTAVMELTEETGYSSNALAQVGQFNPYNGVTDEMCHVYLARDLQFVGSSPDETEEFVVVFLSPAEVEQQIRDGSIWDGMTLAAWSILKISQRV